MHFQQAPIGGVLRAGGYDSDVEGGSPYGDDNAGFQSFSEKAVSSIRKRANV